MTMWPPGMTIRPLTRPGPHKTRDRSTFRAPWSKTLNLLDRELWNLNAKTVVLELDYRERDLRLDGMPRADARMLSPAVAISFESRYGPLRYDADVFDDWQDNLRAIALGLEALRKVDRYGITRRGEQYTGWKALPATPSGETPLDLLRRYAPQPWPRGLADTPRELYAAAVKRHHPDMPGGTSAAFLEIQAAREQLRAAGDW